MTYLQHLQELARQAQAPKIRYVPVKEQIRTLMSSLTPRQRNRGWTTTELAAQLEGRYAAHPSLNKVAEALTELGWVARRDWTKAGRNRRYWIPSEK